MDIPIYFIYIALFVLFIPMLGTTLAMLVGVLSYFDAHREPAPRRADEADALKALTASLRTAARRLGHTVAEVTPAGSAVVDDGYAPAGQDERRVRQRRLDERRRGERRLYARGNSEDRRRRERRRSERRGVSSKARFD